MHCHFLWLIFYVLCEEWKFEREKNWVIYKLTGMSQTGHKYVHENVSALSPPSYDSDSKHPEKLAGFESSRIDRKWVILNPFECVASSYDSDSKHPEKLAGFESSRSKLSLQIVQTKRINDYSAIIAPFLTCELKGHIFIWNVMSKTIIWSRLEQKCCLCWTKWPLTFLDGTGLTFLDGK